MGLIKALKGSVGGVLADQWKDFFYCDSLSADILAAKGKKRVSKRSSNTKGDDNIISNGSVVTVNEGQCMMIVEQGKVVDLCAEPGEFVYDMSSEPSIFASGLSEGIKNTFYSIGKRFTFGGDTGKDQRIYYFNIKEIMGNKYGTMNPVPFRVVDTNIGLDIDVSIRCNGEYSYKMIDPLLFYTNVSGNVPDVFERSKIDSQLKSELLTALQPAFARISEMGIRYSALPGHTLELASALNEILSQKWGQTRGLAIGIIGINSVNASKEDEDMIKQLQKSAVMRDPTMAAAALAGSQADAMRAAASNTGGAMTGFMGMNMASQAGGMNMNDLYAMGSKNNPPAPAPAAPAAQSADTWACACGVTNKGRFCSECGKARPEDDSWQCDCGSTNKGRFCIECGKPKPQANGWKCACGTVNKGRFCSECGQPEQ
jgi:membrane protease subunit (stomatin/prohibitin family)